MTYKLNSKISDLQPYTPILGSYPIRLDANESFRQPTSEILDKIKAAVSEIDFNRYPDPYALEPRKAFAQFYGIDEAFVTAGNGSDELISVILGAFVMKGDTVLTLSPDFSMYRFYAFMNEVKSLEYQTNPEDFSLDLDRLISTIKENNVKALIFSNPCNPTGRGLSRDEVRKLIRSVDSLIILDEAYMDFWDQSLIQEAETYDNLILLRTCSKMFGMAALRLGFAVANSTITNAIQAVKSPYNVNACTQKIAAVVLKEKEWIHAGLKEIKESQKQLFAELKKLESSHKEELHVYDSVTNFVFVKVKESKRIFDDLKKHGIVVRYMNDCLRITAGTEEENREFLRVFQAVL